MFAEAGEEELAAGSHLLGGGGAEHLFDGGGDLGGDGGDFGLSHGDEENDVAMEELGGAVDNLGAHGGLGEVGDPENQSPAGLDAAEDGGGAEVVSFTGLGSELGEGFEDLTHVGGSAVGEELLLDATAVAEEADAVAGVEGELGESDSSDTPARNFRPSSNPNVAAGDRG